MYGVWKGMHTHLGREKMAWIAVLLDALILFGIGFTFTARMHILGSGGFPCAGDALGWLEPVLYALAFLQLHSQMLFFM